MFRAQGKWVFYTAMAVTINPEWSAGIWHEAVDPKVIVMENVTRRQTLIVPCQHTNGFYLTISGAQAKCTCYLAIGVTTNPAWSTGMGHEAV